jgi:hypothetical protein
MALFKSRQQREAERNLKVRRAKKRLSREVSRLRKERDKYRKLGQEAAKQGRREKVKLVARAILKFQKMEKRFQDILITLEMFEAQKEMMTIQREFADAMNACVKSINNADIAKVMSNLDADVEAANKLVDEANAKVDAFLESGQEGILQGEETAEDQDDQLRELEQELTETAMEDEQKATPDRIDDDIAEIEKELNKEL